ncbi:MAG: hypothetical protein AAGF92_14545 [Myxococcota bacterium]
MPSTQREAFARRIAVFASAATVFAGCGIRGGAPPGTPGHVSDANQACAGLFCSAEAESEADPRCAPTCACGALEFTEPVYDEQDVHALRSWRLLNPTLMLEADPFAEALPEDEPPEAYCAAIPMDSRPEIRTYRLETFQTERSARAAGGQITHRGRCGACSSFQDLATYVELRDLNRAGRRCGMQGMLGDDLQLRCLQNLGFTDACAQIWSFNIENTRAECMGTCTATIPMKHKLPDGSLNACLACDEVHSGPTFKAVAGRTRRRSGLSSAIARPCLDAEGIPAVYPVEHFYFTDARR